MAECKKYKTGEVPKIGDLVWRYRSGIFPQPHVKQWGIVTGYWLSMSRNSKLPVICWAGTDRPKKALTTVLRLYARGNKNA